MELPREESLRWIVSRYAGLHARHGAGIGRPDVVLPTGEYFPDAFTPTGEGVGRLVARMLEYAPVRAGLDLRLRFVEAGAKESVSGCGKGGCGTGACGPGAAEEAPGRVIETAAGYLVELPTDAVAHPVVLTSTLARAIGGIVLAEADEEVPAGEHGGLSELAAVASGFGVLLANGAHVYGKSCGGARVSCHTQLALEEISVALALFTRLHDVKPKTVKAYFEVTQREAFDDAYDWVTSNPSLVTQLRARPEILEAGLFRCEETKGFFGKNLAARAAAQEERAFGLVPNTSR